MTELYLKEFLQAFQISKAQVSAWKCCIMYDGNSNIKSEYEKRSLQIQIMEHAMEVLDEKEKFVIEYHLINGKTWDETSLLFDNRWGVMDGRSVRTLKRMQGKALKKMHGFLRKSDLERYFT